MNWDKMSTLISVVLLLIGLLFIGVGSAQSDDWPDERDNAADVSPGEHTGTISSQDDTDYLRVPVQQGDTVTVTLDKEIRKDTRMVVDVPGASEGLSDEGADTLTRKLTAEENGFLYIRILSTTADEGSESWELDIQRLRGADKWRDRRENADDISGSATGEVNSPDDTDYLRVPVQQGDTVTVTLDKEIRKDTRMVVDVPGASEGLSDEGADTLTRKLTAEENGFLYIRILSTTVTTDTEPWEVTVERNNGADKWRDRRENANEISRGSYSGVVNSPDDTDYLRVPVRQGDTVTVNLEKRIGTDTRMVVDVPGASEGLSDEGADTLTRKLTAEENGFLYIRILSTTVTTDAEPWLLGIDTKPDGDLSRSTLTPTPTSTLTPTQTATPSTSTPETPSNSTPTPKNDNGESDNGVQDSDGDGVIDSEDYAPDDPEVQEKSDLQDTPGGSGSGFGLGVAFIALLISIFVALHRS